MTNKKIMISANVLFTIINFRESFIQALLEKGFEVICVASDDELSALSKQNIDSLSIRFIPITINRKGLNPLQDILYLFSLAKIYRQEKPLCIFHFTIKPNIYGTLAAKLARIPSVNTINGLGSALMKQSLLSFILKQLYRFALRFSHTVFFQNQADRDFFVNSRLVNKTKTAMVPGSGVDTQSFSNLSPNNTPFTTFLLVARLIKDKGIYEYIQAIRELKQEGIANAQFLLAGPFDSGNPTAIQPHEVTQWTQEGLVTFLGHTHDITLFLKQTNAIVLPSYREGLSRLLIEACSAYKPIITTRTPGCQELVEDGKNGYLCEVKDSASLKQAIEKMIRLTQEEREKMGEHSHHIASSQFDHTLVNRIYLEAIKQCSM